MRRLFLFLFLLIAFSGLFSSKGYCEEKRVLMISAYHPGFPTFFQQIEGVKSVLDPQGVLLDVEFMDSKRFYTPENLSAFHDLLSLKLKSLPQYDVVITSDDNALKFALEYREELFPKTPVVFCGVNNQEMALLMNRNDNFTGVIESTSIEETLALVPRLLPGTKTVNVIVDSTPSGQADLSSFEDVRYDFSNIKFNILSLEDLSWAELRESLKGISSSNAVLLLAAYRDKNGISKSFDDSLAFITFYSKAPIFHPYEHGIGNGILGGKVVSHFVQGEIAGNIALDVIKGEAVQGIPVVESGRANKYIFDRKQLKLFRVTDSSLPADSIIINEELTVFKTHRFEVMILAVFVFVLLVFIVALLFYYIRLRNTEDKVRESEERFAMAMEANKDGIWDWDIRTDQVYYSPGYKAMLGYAVDEVPAHVDSWLDLINEDDRGRAFKANNDCIENRSANFEVEFRMQAKDGEWRWILGRGNAVERDSEGRALRMIGTHTDITERKRSEEEIRGLRNYLKSIIDSMPFVLIGLDEGCFVTQWNAKAEQESGISSDYAVGRRVDEVFPRLIPQMQRIENALEKGELYMDSRVQRRESGDVLYDDITVYPLNSDEGHGGAIILEDVTERVRLEEMVVQNEKMLSVGGLAAGMAHEINNPLGAILQGAQNIQRRTLGDLGSNYEVAAEYGLDMENIRGYLRERGIPKMINGINDAAGRAAKIVSNMLSFSRKSEDNFREHDLSLLMDEVIDLAANEYDLTTKYDFRRIEIVRDYDGHTPAVYCERSEIQQVFLNLLKNGAQSMNAKDYKGERPRFTLRVHRNEDNVQVEIEDNGQGIDKSVQKRIFEPFYTTKRVGEGTGLGLAISYFIITDLHKGSMEVFSSPGNWTRFIINLPLGKRIVH